MIEMTTVRLSFEFNHSRGVWKRIGSFLGDFNYPGNIRPGSCNAKLEEINHAYICQTADECIKPSSHCIGAKITVFIHACLPV